jgi:hypothetical protein
MTHEMLTPKGDFLKDSKRASTHQEIVANPALKEAIKIALLQYAMDAGGEDAEPNKLATIGLRLEGAKGFIDAFMNLGNKSKPMMLPQDHQLDNV